MRFLAHVTLGGRDSQPGCSRVGYYTSAILQGRLAEAKQRNFCSGPYLADSVGRLASCPGLFDEISLTGYSRMRGRSREVIYSLAEPYRDLIREENVRRFYGRDHQLCMLVSGWPCDRYSTAMDRRALEIRLDRRLQSRDWGCSRTLEFARHFNQKPSNGFTNMVRSNLELVAESIYGQPTERHEHLFNFAVGVIDCPKPLYQPSSKGRTSRVFPACSCLLTVPREMRKDFCAGCYDCDIVNSQLCIAGHRWDIPELLDFCKTGESIWQVMETDLGISIAGERKRVLKHEGLYPLMYGRTVARALSRLIESGQFTPEEAESFLQHDLITALIDARDRVIARAVQEGTYTTFYGACLPVIKEVPPGRKRPKWNIHSILAHDAQDVEMELMASLLPFDDPQFARLVLFQHDGMTVRFADRARVEKSQQRMLRIFEEHARAMGIPARLTWDPCWMGDSRPSPQI